MNLITLEQEKIFLQEYQRRKLAFYSPYPKQIKFHNASSEYHEILLMAANRVGKTMAAAAQAAMHALGIYPDWYQGRKFKKAPVIWCAGVSGAAVRDSIQKLLIGDIANPGTGFLPVGTYETVAARSVADLVDTITVNHVSGSKSRINLKMYEQGREKFQADSVDFVWLDEEPDDDVYMEALTRTYANSGYLVMTFTPLKGLSKVVKRFTREKSAHRCVINMTIEDALHISDEDRKRQIDSYDVHQQEARAYGRPVLGSGIIFPVMRRDIACDPFPMDNVPFYWQELAGIDFAGSGEDGHPTAAVKLLYNTQDDIIYVTNTYRRKGGTPMVHAAALRAWGKVPFAWPHDGLQHDKSSGVPLKDIYKNEGLNMLTDNARFEDGDNGVEAGITALLMRMETGRLKIFSHLTDLFEEMDGYYRDEGKIVKIEDDLICALRYSAGMCLRFAKRVSAPKGKMGHYAIEDSAPYDSYNDPNYNPLGRDYASILLTGKT